MLKQLRKSQDVLEYAALMAIVIGALIGMQVYLKRSLQGRLKEETDKIGPQASVRSDVISFVNELESSSSNSIVKSDGSKEVNYENFFHKNINGDVAGHLDEELT